MFIVYLDVVIYIRKSVMKAFSSTCPLDCIFVFSILLKAFFVFVRKRLQNNQIFADILKTLLRRF